jgi:hypothetical protein
MFQTNNAITMKIPKVNFIHKFHKSFLPALNYCTTIART